MILKMGHLNSACHPSNTNEREIAKTAFLFMSSSASASSISGTSRLSAFAGSHRAAGKHSSRIFSVGIVHLLIGGSGDSRT
jgi:hypothetical protein